MNRAAAVGALALVGTLVLAAPAPATLTCEFNSAAPRPLLTVLLKGNQITRLDVDGGTIDVADNSGVPIPCSGGTPTTTTTDQVTIKTKGRKPRQQTALIEDPGAFVPGVEDEGMLEIDEIEFTVRLGRGKDGLTLLGGSDPDHFTAGTDGVNTNADDVLGPDLEFRLKKVERLHFDGGAGADEISAAGGDAAGDAWARPVLFGESAGDNDLYIGGSAGDSIAGGSGGDEIHGGDGDDVLIGAPGDDDLFGEEGDDELIGAADADLLSGGPGADAATYSAFNGSPVVVDIGAGVTNDGGPADGPAGDRDDVLDDVENLQGEEEDDSFTGDDDANVLLGGLGVDSLLGLGGKDLLKAKDGVADSAIDCGTGHDTAKFDAGLDPAPISC